jgi:hypothetical protein
MSFFIPLDKFVNGERQQQYERRPDADEKVCKNGFVCHINPQFA